MLGAVLPGARHPAGRADAERQDHRRRRRRVQHVLLGDRRREARAAGRLRRPGAHRHRRGPHGHLPPALPPGAADLGEGGRRQQLRAGPLHDRQGDRRPGPGPHPQARGQLHGAAGVHDLPRLRRRDRLGPRVPDARAPLRGLRQEVQAELHDLGLPPDSHRGGGALQHRAVRALAAGAHRRDDHDGQRGALRHLPPQPGHRAPHVHQSEPPPRADNFIVDRLSAL
mmetsp:Transcript_49063/g.138591  ORF Transcript_49063/g.138591 Transcript_49063/m.138591 type:complete len:226 (+) Transcript_49063:163-840(+)